MEDVDLDDVLYEDAFGVGLDEDDAVSYGDMTVRRSHISEKKPDNRAPIDRTGATAMVDLHRLTVPLKDFRNVFATEGALSDQLPHREEYKMQSAYGVSSNRRGIREMLKQSAYNGGYRRKARTSLTGFLKNHAEGLFVALMVFCILLGMILFGSAKMDSGGGGRGAPSEASTNQNGGEHNSQARYNEIVEFISSQGWTSNYRLKEEGSPQMQAALWLSERSNAQVSIANTPVLRERYALSVLYYATNGDGWNRDVGFLSNADVCEWGIDGVQNKNGNSMRIGADCTCRHPKEEKCGWKDPSTVKRLLLPSMNLEGEIPHEIYLLYDLIELDLNSNRLSGELNQGILLLRSLRLLSLSYNRLEGSIPSWMGDMVELRELNLASNKLNGDLPEDWSKLSHLLMLNLSDNQLSGSLVPLKDLQQMEALFLSDNQLHGPLRPHFATWWPWLRVLDLSDNLIGSTLPGNIFSHPTLRVVDLHGNDMGGDLPEVAAQSKIEFLALQDNALVGSIPNSINNLSNMYHLDLSKNKLTGTIPQNLSALEKLEYLFLSFNPFTEGIIPHYLATLTNLRDLSLQKTRRTGKIPAKLGGLSNLVLLDLGDNALSGNIPTNLGNLSQLHYLILYRNYLVGSIPRELASLDHLSKLIVSENDFTERADYMCAPKPPVLAEFLMSCDKDPNSNYPYCPCCQCCVEADVNCDSVVWFSGFDPTWDTKFVRQHYTFHQNEIPFTPDSLSEEGDT